MMPAPSPPTLASRKYFQKCAETRRFIDCFALSGTFSPSSVGKAKDHGRDATKQLRAVLEVVQEASHGCPNVNLVRDQDQGRQSNACGLILFGLNELG